MFNEEQISGYQEEVQLREQDFGNFQVRPPTSAAFRLCASATTLCMLQHCIPCIVPACKHRRNRRDTENTSVQGEVGC